MRFSIILFFLLHCSAGQKVPRQLPEKPVLVYIIAHAPEIPAEAWSRLEEQIRGLEQVGSILLSDRSLYLALELDQEEERQLAYAMGATHIFEVQKGLAILTATQNGRSEKATLASAPPDQKKDQPAPVRPATEVERWKAVELSAVTLSVRFLELLGRTQKVQGKLHTSPLRPAAGSLLFQSRLPSHVPALLAAGQQALSMQRPQDALAFFAKAHEIGLVGRTSASDQALALRGIGLARYYGGARNLAVANLKAGLALLNQAGFGQSFYAHLLLLDLDALEQKKPALLPQRALELWPLLGALHNYQQGVFLLAAKKPEEALKHFDASSSVLIEKKLMNSDLFLALLFNTGNAALFSGQHFKAMVHYTWAHEHAMILGIQDSPAARKINTNRELLEAYLSAQYAPDAKKSAFNLEQIALPDTILSSDLPLQAGLFQTRREYDRIASYTGAFDFRSHPQIVKSRTYSGRHDDTNLFLKDLLVDRRQTPELERLRQIFLEGRPAPLGRDLLFIEIGPGLGHPLYPAVTTMSLAQDFKEMHIVALDLPDQVSYFMKHVPIFRRKKVLETANLSILSGDGTRSLIEQWNEPDNWISRKPGLALIAGMPVLIRTVNAIDIYSHWNDVGPALERMAQDFKEHAVLLFFNRNICLKLRGQEKFYIVGSVSGRGFHHNVNSLERSGEYPYTISSMVMFLKQ